jgi:hypothetical protein
MSFSRSIVNELYIQQKEWLRYTTGTELRASRDSTPIGIILTPSDGTWKGEPVEGVHRKKVLLENISLLSPGRYALYDKNNYFLCGAIVSPKNVELTDIKGALLFQESIHLRGKTLVLKNGHTVFGHEEGNNIRGNIFITNRSSFHVQKNGVLRGNITLSNLQSDKKHGVSMGTSTITGNIVERDQTENMSSNVNVTFESYGKAKVGSIQLKKIGIAIEKNANVHIVDITSSHTPYILKRGAYPRKPTNIKELKWKKGTHSILMTARDYYRFMKNRSEIKIYFNNELQDDYLIVKDTVNRVQIIGLYHEDQDLTVLGQKILFLSPDGRLESHPERITTLPPPPADYIW